MVINKTQMMVTIGLLLTLLAAVVSAQERKGNLAMTSAQLQYQGRLTDPSTGGPVADGSYTMVFRFYTAPSGGTAVWTEAKDVPVQGGLYSTVLGDTAPFDLGLFNGQALWLGIKVGGDEEANPRQQIVPVAYALSLVPGASIQANSNSAALNLSNTGGGEALAAKGPVAVAGDLSVDGSLIGGTHFHSDYVGQYEFHGHYYDANAHHDRYSDEEAVNAALNDPNILNSYWGGLHTNDASAHHARYTNGEAVNAVLATDGSGSGLDADKLDGQQASAFATADHGHAMLPIAIGVISSNGNVISATGNVTSRGWDEFNRCYRISIAGHSYDRDSYVTVVMDTANVGTFYTNDIELNYSDVCLQFINPDEERLQFGFKFVIFKT